MLRIAFLIYLNIGYILSAQVQPLSIKSSGPREVILDWDDTWNVVLQVAPSGDGPWVSLKPPLSHEPPLVIDTTTGPILSAYSQEVSFDQEVYMFRLKEASVLDIQPESGFVGRVSDTDAFAAMLVASEECVAYVCNGEEEISEWFRGEITDPLSIQLSNGSGAALSAAYAIEDHAYSGSVVLRNGSEHDITFLPNQAEDAGIFRIVDDEAEAQDVEAGWIVNEQAEERGFLRIRSKTAKPPRIGDIKDGTSNTLVVAESRFTFFRFTVKRRLDRRSVIQLAFPGR